jgi:tetratricopeptide (TPR) repeat protein
VAVGGHVYDQRSFHLPAAPPAAPAFVVPYPHNPLFTGRDVELVRLGEWLDSGQCVAVVGTGGLGKTQLAAEYALAARNRYPGGVFWLNMEQPEGIAGQVAALAGPGGLNLPAAPALDFAGKVAAVRAAWTEPVARLLIFDNLEDPAVWREWRPTSGGARVLLTSRRQTWTATSGVRPLVLPALPRAAGQELLLAPRAAARATTPAALLTDPATASEADAICEALGDLPLALALAGAYLEATPSVTLARYRAVIEAAPLARLEIELEDTLPTGHAASILHTFALSYDKLDASKPGDALARTLLHCAACLAPAPIPRHLLLRAAELDPADAFAQEDADHALRRLAALGLIEDLGAEGVRLAALGHIEALGGEGVRLHRLLAAYARHRAADPAHDAAAVETALVAQFAADEAAGNAWSGHEYLEHLRYVVKQAGPRTDARIATLCHSLAEVLYEMGDWNTAGRLHERALAIREQILGPAHPDTAESLNELAVILQEQGDLARARPYLERALAIREQNLGPTHPTTSGSLNDLGLVLQLQGDLAGARPYYERAVAIREQTLGPDHPTTANTLNNLGLLLQQQGDFAAARPYLERALAITQQTLGPTHPRTAISLHNLGFMLREQGDLAGARPYFERALAITQQTLGPAHPDTAYSLNSLGRLLQAQGDLAGARAYLERALAIREQALGPTHPMTAISLHNLGTLLDEQGDPAGALALLERALPIREQELGPDHPETDKTRRRLAAVRQALEAPGGGA